MKDKLTDRQKEILLHIQQFINENGFPPTLREIAAHFGMASTFGVKRHLDALKKKGYLKIESFASRAISLNKPSFEEIESEEVNYNSKVISIPVVGRVAAGSPILSEENLDGMISIDSNFFKNNKDCFALRVSGDSMINAGIFDGDLVIVNPDEKVSQHDIVVARVDDEITVKNYEKKNNKILLIPQNEKYEPITVTEKNNFSIVGKVIGVLRWFN
ncbi:MAG: transcriptional repressor LexA [Ignavibacterium sp.]|jgi:repressor LexA|uniref:LexA repressor n=1 Tax=Ignavibacterium album TaxID=591197 RepID=A0A7V2ZI52_9BACT|nr:transcriptional repressor LexA [Ignavibacterium album]MCA2004768.1 transcriptional repressor LexA [Ignavibacterium sp.]MCX8105803.1 transcriptional repressor LexA [Ignavibacterium album]